MIEMKYQNRPYYLMPGGLVRILVLCLFPGFGFACANESASNITSEGKTSELILDKRIGAPPEVPHRVPHQQLDQNSPPEILKKLKTFLFSLEHVEERSSRNSFPSALGAYIDPGIRINDKINREFTHIHMEPGPGSQHLALTEKDFQQVNEKGWGIKHPWSEKLMDDGLVLVMLYAPRSDNDLDNVKKIISAAWQLALSSD